VRGGGGDKRWGEKVRGCGIAERKTRARSLGEGGRGGTKVELRESCRERGGGIRRSKRGMGKRLEVIIEGKRMSRVE